MTVSLGELAVRFGCELRGDPATLVDSVATLGRAHPRAVCFLANPRYRHQLSDTTAAAVILEPRYAAECPVAALMVPNPYATYARVAAVLQPAREAEPPGTHPSAVIAATARIDPSAHIGPHVVIGARASIGAHARLGPQCVIEEDVAIGADATWWPVSRCVAA